MATPCPMCMRATVTRAGQICSGCMRAKPPSVRLPYRDKLPTGPVPNWPKIWKATRRGYHVLLRQVQLSMRPVASVLGTESEPPYDPALAAMYVTLTNGMERASCEERKWIAEEVEKGGVSSPQQQAEIAIDYLASKQVPDDTKRRAVALILESLGETHLAVMDAKKQG